MMQNDAVRGPSRRDFLVLGAGIFAVAAAGGALTRRRVVRRSVPVMGTLADLVVVTKDERHARGALDAAVKELYEVERLMTRFDPRSDIGRANRMARREAVPVSGATAAVLSEALRWAAVPGSAFDPAIGRITELWDVQRRSEPPAQPAVARLAGRALWRQVELDTYRGAPAVRFASDEIALDLGGIAKGYAVDRAVATLRDWGVRDALVNAGGDLYALGVSAEGDDWNVGIRSPSDPGRLDTSFTLRDRAVATSGDYEQFFQHGGRRYHHLLDPATAEPRISTARSLSIAAASCMAADAAATALFALPPAVTEAVLHQAAPHAELIRSV